MWKELADGLRKSKTSGREVVPQRGGAALGDGLLDSCREDEGKKSLSQYKELLRDDTIPQRLEDKSNLCSGFFHPVNVDQTVAGVIFVGIGLQ